jgi:hypothetical protein
VMGGECELRLFCCAIKSGVLFVRRDEGEGAVQRERARCKLAQTGPSSREIFRGSNETRDQRPRFNEAIRMRLSRALCTGGNALSGWSSYG